MWTGRSLKPHWQKALTCATGEKKHTHTFSSPDNRAECMQRDREYICRVSVNRSLHLDQPPPSAPPQPFILREKLFLTKRAWSGRRPPAGTDEDKHRKERKPSWLSLVLQSRLELAQVCRPLVWTAEQTVQIYFIIFILYCQENWQLMYLNVLVLLTDTQLFSKSIKFPLSLCHSLATYLRLIVFSFYRFSQKNNQFVLFLQKEKSMWFNCVILLASFIKNRLLYISVFLILSSILWL